jgi:hypothetical protein
MVRRLAYQQLAPAMGRVLRSGAVPRPAAAILHPAVDQRNLLAALAAGAAVTAKVATSATTAMRSRRGKQLMPLSRSSCRCRANSSKENCAVARPRSGHVGTRVISTFVSSASASTELTNVVGPTVTPFHSASVRHRTMRA